jgi:tape measure domain-containing protein
MYVGITMDDAKFKQGIKDAQNKLEGLKSRMAAAEASSKKLAAGLAVIGAALMAAGLKSIKMAGDLEQTRIAFTTMLGSAEAADAFIKQLYDFAAKTPFEIEGLSTAARQLLAFGFQAEEIIPMMESIGNAVSGLGGGAFEIERVTRALGQMQAKGKVSAEEMMQLAELGIPVWDMLAKKIGVSIPEAMDKASKGGISAAEGINAIIEGMNERFPDMMQKQSESLLGIFSNLQDSISQTMTFIGEEIVETFDLKGSLKTVVESLERLSELIGEEGLSGALDQMSIVAKTAIVAIAGAITAALIPAFIALGKAIWAAMAPLLPFMAIGAAVAALAYLIYKAWSSNMFGIQDKIKATAMYLSANFQTSVALVMTAFNKLKEVVYRVLQSIMDAVGPVVGVLGKVAPGIEEAFGKAQKAMQEKGDAASEEALKQATALKKAAGNLKASAGEMKDAFSDWSTPVSLGKGASFADFRKKFEASAGSDPVTGAADAMEKAAGKGAKAAKDLKAAWETAAESLKTRLAQVKTIFDITGNQLDMTGTKAEQLRNKIDALSAQMEVQKQVIEETNSGYEQMKAEKGENSEEAEKLKLKLLEEKKALSDLEKQLFDTKQALQDHAQEFRDLAAEIDKVEKKYKDDLAAALEDYQRKVEEVNRKVREEERRTIDEYNRAVEERTRALSNFVGLFDQVARRDVSGESLLANLRGQVDAFENWSENISTLAARGVDQGLIEELKQMGPKAGPEIAALNTLTDEQLVEYVGLWRRKNEEARAEAINQLQQQRVEMQQKLQEIRQSASEQLELYRVEWEKKNAEIKKNTEEELTKIQNKFEELAKRSTVFGQQFVMGFVGGMESRFDSLRKAAEEMASIVATGVTGPLEIRSPSRLMFRHGIDIMEGLIQGAASKMPSFEKLMGGIAMLTPAAIGPSITNSSSNTSNVFNIHVSGGGTREQAEGIMRELHRLGVRF